MPAPKRPNTAAATAARSAKARERRLEAMADELRGAGYEVTAPIHARIAEIEREVRENPGPIVRDPR